jgi:transposase
MLTRRIPATCARTRASRGCWAHARRRFFEVLGEKPKALQLVLRLIGRLYQLERAWDQAPVGDARAALRQEHLPGHSMAATPRARIALAPRSLLGKACSYLLNHWDVFVEHQQHLFTRLDNNLVENAIRPSAIGK